MPKLNANGLNFHYQQAGAGPGRRPDPRRHGRPVDLVPVRGHGGARPLVPGDGLRPARPRLQRRAARSATRRPTRRATSWRSWTPSRSIGPCWSATASAAVIAMHAAVLHPDRIDAVVLSDPCFPALRHLEDLSRWGHWQNFREEAAAGGRDAFRRALVRPRPVLRPGPPPRRRAALEVPPGRRLARLESAACGWPRRPAATTPRPSRA